MEEDHSDRGAGDGLKMWPSPIGDKHWRDEAGDLWRLRGERWQITPKRVEHLLLASSTRVLLFYGPDGPRDVGPEDRSALWERVRPCMTRRGPQQAGDHTAFAAGEFKDGNRGTLLIIEESC